MVRKAKFIADAPTRLSRVLDRLNAPPKLHLSGLKSLKLSLAQRNDHFGARHFVKEELPRIRYANPNLEVHVEKVPKGLYEKWRPEMELEFVDGKKKKLDLHERWSTTIVKELMEAAGGNPWQEYKLHVRETGGSLLPGEERASLVARRDGKLPTLAEYRAANPNALAKKDGKKEKAVAVPPQSRVTSGAAAVLP